MPGTGFLALTEMIKTDYLLHLSSYTNTDLIKKSFLFAKEYLGEKKRISGQLVIDHCLKVAEELAKLKTDAETISAGLLHSLANENLSLIKKEFSSEIAGLLEDFLKIAEIKKKNQREQAEYLKMLLLILVKDIRAIIIKLIDKLENFKTIAFLPEGKQKEIARETLEIYAPLAYRLGIYKIKSELEDKAFSILQPEEYQEIEKKIQSSLESRSSFVERIKKEIAQELNKQRIYFEIKARAKGIYSVYNKIHLKGRRFEEISDFFGIRIITKKVDDCYKVLSLLHQLWPPLPERFKDYIVNPKVNFYQSIHTTLLVSEGGKEEKVEIQIRTKEMDEIAEEGMASHWVYKSLKGKKDFEKKLSWIRELLKIQEKNKAKKVIDSLKEEVFSEQIYCYTPKGDLIELPQGATVLDFAYALHSDLGDHCRGGEVNGRFVSLKEKLKTSDLVRIITDKRQVPHRDWLKIVKTSKAKQKIKSYLKEKEKAPVKILKPKIPLKVLSGEERLVEVKGLKNPLVKFARCCSPLPDQKIAGQITRKGLVMIHQFDCPNLQKRFESFWKKEINGLVYLKVIALERSGLLADLFNRLTHKSQIQEAKAKMIDPLTMEAAFRIKIDYLENLKRVIELVRKTPGVKKVFLGEL